MAVYEARTQINGLGTFAIFTAPQAGVYFVNGQLTLPRTQDQLYGNGSSVVCTVKQNSSTLQTTSAGSNGFQVISFVCAAGDVISVVLASSAAVDNALNAVTGQVVGGNAQ